MSLLPGALGHKIITSKNNKYMQLTLAVQYNYAPCEYVEFGHIYSISKADTQV